MSKHIVIIGNGIAGITTARWVRKLSDHKITVISSETDHFFSRTALMYIYMGHMEYRHTKPYEDYFWEKNRIDLKRAHVDTIDFEARSLHFDSGESMNYDDLVLALGSTPNKFGWPGQDLKGVSGLYHFQDLEYMEEYTRDIDRAVVVGGGLIGIEMAEMLHSRDIPVTFLVREKSFWNGVLQAEESDLINRHIRKNHIDLRLGTELDKILADEQGRAKAVVTKDGETIDCQFVGLTAGVSPNIAFLKDTALETDRGILVDEYLRSNIPHVYAIGDCAQVREPQPGRRPIEAVWYVGRMMGETLAHTLTGTETAYRPGHWFNSAKFIDIEYQTYGLVPGHMEEQQAAFYWEHEDELKAVKFVFDKESLAFEGVNTFGIRMRHEVFQRWLEEKRGMPYILNHLAEANFDPEFFKTFEKEIGSKWNAEHPDHKVSPTSNRSFLSRLFA